RRLLVVEIAALGTILAAARHSTPVPHEPGRLVAAESEPAAGIPGQDAGDGAYPGGDQPGLEAPSSGPVAVVRGSGGDEDQAVERRRHARGKEQAELTTEAVSDEIQPPAGKRLPQAADRFGQVELENLAVAELASVPRPDAAPPLATQVEQHRDACIGERERLGEGAVILRRHAHRGKAEQNRRIRRARREI